MTNDDAPEQCVILIGGLGTRLGSITAACPKPLLPVGGKPFLDELIYHVKRFGFKRILLLAGYRADVVADYVAARTNDLDIEIQAVIEPSPLGTGGALKFAADRLDATFLLMNGDSLFDFNWLDLVPLRRATSTTLAMALRRQDDCSRFGIVELSGDRVTGFKDRGNAAPGRINGGVYLVSRDIIAALPDNGSLERDVLPALATQGRLAGRTYSGFFIDIGVPETYAAAGELVTANRRRPAVFLDRAILIRWHRERPDEPADFEWMPGAIETIKLANDHGLHVFIFGDRDESARGFLGRRLPLLRRVGAHIDDIWLPPETPEADSEMIPALLKRWPIDLARSVMLGETERDIIAAQRANVASRVMDGQRPDAVLADWLATTAAPSSS